MTPPKSIVLYSGGLDSTVLLWSLRPNVKALLCNYGQRHIKELISAHQLCNEFGIEHEIADLYGIHHLLEKGSQSGEEEVPEGHYTDLSMKTTIVPNRNSIMLSIAVGWAVATGCKEVYFAAHSGDHTIYPDCRPNFIDAFSHAEMLGNEWNPVNIQAPFQRMTKAGIVATGARLNVPFEKTWSCYKGGFLHCGKCGTCVERKEAFELAKVKDPTEYE